MVTDASAGNPPVAIEISDAVERLYLDRFGKGPLRTDTFLHGDVITTLLRDVFTPVEKALIDDGRSDSVLSNRIQWQSATDALFRSAVAQATGRDVLAAISGFDAAHDLATEVFVLAPKQA